MCVCVRRLFFLSNGSEILEAPIPPHPGASNQLRLLAAQRDGAGAVKTAGGDGRRLVLRQGSKRFFLWAIGRAEREVAGPASPRRLYLNGVVVLELRVGVSLGVRSL